MATYTIGRLAEAAGVHVETVRYYERRGLLRQPPRSPGGYRQYGDDDLWRLQFVGRGKTLGFTLTEIAELLEGSGDGSAEAVLRAAHRKIAALVEREAALAETRARLAELADVCANGDAVDCMALQVTRPVRR